MAAIPAADAVCADLIGILDTVDLPIVVVGRDFTVARFNRPAASALGLTASHLGQLPRSIGLFTDLTELEKLCIGDRRRGAVSGATFGTETGGSFFELPRTQAAMVGSEAPYSRLRT